MRVRSTLLPSTVSTLIRGRLRWGPFSFGSSSSSSTTIEFRVSEFRELAGPSTSPPLPLVVVLVLNRDANRGGHCDPPPPAPLRPIVCRLRMTELRAVRLSTLRSVKGKYSCRWLVMSSLGGRCPKKLRSLPSRGDLSVVPPGDVGGEETCMPSPLSTDTVLARFNFFVAVRFVASSVFSASVLYCVVVGLVGCRCGVRYDDGECIRRRWRFSRDGSAGSEWKMASSSLSESVFDGTMRRNRNGLSGPRSKRK